MLRLVSVGLFFVTFGSSVDVEHGEIAVAMIAEGPPKDTLRHHKMGNAHAMEFIARVFSETFPNRISSRTIWPPVYTENCPGNTYKDVTSFNKVHKSGYQRGLMMAHRQVWEEFVVVNKDIPANISSYESPKVIIFEDDAMEVDPSAPDIAYQSVQNMTSQLHYLGHCYDRYPGTSPPECAHAYALTVEGARILLRNMDWCAHKFGGALDQQFKTFGLDGTISWSAVPASFPYGISDDFIQKKALNDGFSIEWGNAAGGLFHQVYYDDILDPKDGGLYKVKWPHKTVYLYQNSTYHQFNDLKTFIAMGFDFDDVSIIPLWQLTKALGDAVPNTL